jgi:NMD protein affecting ribosome stability and mRNA decay
MTKNEMICERCGTVTGYNYQKLCSECKTEQREIYNEREEVIYYMDDYMERDYSYNMDEE